VWFGLIRPYLEYGAEIWNSETDCKWAEAEAIQRKMGKRILKVKSSCPDEAVMGELGWISLAGRRMMLRLFFWRKILMCGAGRWVRRVYEASRRRAEAGRKSWCSLTRLWLRQLGLGDHWDRQEVGHGWRELVRERVQRFEEVRWRARMATKAKLGGYMRWKTELKYEEYLNYRDSGARRALTCLRSSSHTLRVETGRWEYMWVDGARVRLQRAERRCRLCCGGVEDEEHFLLTCPRFRFGRAAGAAVLGRFATSPAERAYVEYIRTSGGSDSELDPKEVVTWMMTGKRVWGTMIFVKDSFKKRKRWLEWC
jgi:hypothetical protein